MIAQRERTAQAPRSALIHCRDLTRHHSKTFYFGSTFFRGEQRCAVWAVYAACRMGDDAVDEGDPASAPERLDTWWEGIDRAYRGDPSDDPVMEALTWAIERYPIPRSAFVELHQGMRMDLDGRTYTDLAELEVYCRRVAGVVGFMIAPICGYIGGEATLDRALRLGQATQLTNILRDVGEDAVRGRLYLPQRLMEHFGVRESDVRQGHLSPEYFRLIRHLVSVARGWYDEGRQGIPCLHGKGRLAVGAAASAYEAILDSIENNGFDNFSRRASVSSTRKLLMLPGVLWSLRGA